jgi:hypothetical protein
MVSIAYGLRRPVSPDGGNAWVLFLIVSQSFKSFKGLCPVKQQAVSHQPPEIPVNYSIYKNFFLTRVF